jgi:uncharacterized protein YkwD
VQAAHNAQRASGGLAPLQYDGTLAGIAQRRAQDMASRGYFAHVSPTGESVFTLTSGLSYRGVGENLAMNSRSGSSAVQTAMSGWMGSAAHRANIMSPSFNVMGVGIATSGRITYIAVVFGLR